MFIFFVSLSGIIIYLILAYIVAKRMAFAAECKGYQPEQSHAFAMCFWLGTLGCLYVIALPDLIAQKQNEQIERFLRTTNKLLNDIKANTVSSVSEDL